MSVALVLIFSGCEGGEDTNTLVVEPGDVTIGPNITRVIFTVVGGTRGVSAPLVWVVSSSAIGQVGASTTYQATYVPAAVVGNNSITVTDLNGSKAVVSVTQVSYNTEQPPVTMTPTRPDTNRSRPGEGISGRLTVTGTEPDIIPDATTYSETVSNIQYNSLNQRTSFDLVVTSSDQKETYTCHFYNIQRNTLGVATSYDAVVNGTAYHYPAS
jgi:hypothetical protein